ncbi:MAG TPA: SDR family NAD(P)-dependent oxidoreductase, partial [Myxococcota bacterium]|nr:SDR family NAD(P)-dependent oxidoreductase [Myxococcota bacterium]
MGWTLEQAPSMEGKVVVVTGANSGIGWEAAWMLAKKGATVVMACRDPGRATDAKERLLQKVPGATVEMLRLDLSSLASVRAAAAELTQRHPKLYALVNNAGVMALPYRKTEDGFEMQFGTNHLGHFALTGLLLPHIEGRVVTVSSVMHRAGRIRFEDLNGEKSYSPWPFYGQSKLANLLFMSELDRRLRKAGSSVKSVACHPGYAAT